MLEHRRPRKCVLGRSRLAAVRDNPLSPLVAQGMVAAVNHVGAGTSVAVQLICLGLHRCELVC
jgi:hypothetical protein